MDCWNIFGHFGHMKQDPQTLMLSKSAKEVHMNKLNQHTKKNIQKNKTFWRCSMLTKQSNILIFQELFGPKPNNNPF